MRIALGRVEYGGDTPPKYFIHLASVGGSFSPLFSDSDELWRKYETGGLEALHAAVPRQSKAVRVIRRTIATGKSFSPDGALASTPRYGLATDDRLLAPTADQAIGYALLETADGGTLHILQRDYRAGEPYYFPICMCGRESAESDRHHALSAFFGKPLPLCQKCIDKMTNPAG